MAAASASAFLFSSSKPNSKSSPNIPTLSFKPHLSPLHLLLLSSTHPKTILPLRCTALQDTPLVEQKPEEPVEQKIQESRGGGEIRRKLFVVNLPWNVGAPDIQKLFGECGTVKDVEIIKKNTGQNKGYAFVTMESGEEAKAVVDKFDAHELNGRIIRVQFAKGFKKPSSPPPPGTPVAEPRYKIYASNLAWKVRSVHLKNFFSEKSFNPTSSRVVFDTPGGKSSGYGFVGFATMEEVEGAITELDGKELLGRPIRLRISQRTTGEPGSDTENEVESAVNNAVDVESEVENAFEVESTVDTGSQSEES